MKLFKKDKSRKQESKGAWVIGGVHKANTTTSPKTIDKGMGVQEYHMWEVHEVTSVVRAVNKGVC